MRLEVGTIFLRIQIFLWLGYLIIALSGFHQSLMNRFLNLGHLALGGRPSFVSLLMNWAYPLSVRWSAWPWQSFYVSYYGLVFGD